MRSDRLRVRRLAAALAMIQLAVLILLAIPEVARPIPTFARKESVSCSVCHVAWPMLNETGRSFQENGYRFSEGYKEPDVISQHLRLEEILPVSTVLISRPFDKVESQDETMQAIQEVSLLIAGTTHEVVSCFAELAAEDETDFEPEIEMAAVGYHPSGYFNVRLAYSNLTQADPHDVYASHRRLTVSEYSVTDSPFGGVDAASGLGAPRQTLSIYGRPARSVFCDVGASAAAEDAEGERPRTFHGRVAVDLPSGITVGALGVGGRWEGDEGDSEYSRLGIDAQIDAASFRVMGAYVLATDDAAAGGEARASGEETNSAFYVQALYALRQESRPVLVPLIRYDGYEMNDGEEQYGDVTLHVSYYAIQNVKLSAEYWGGVTVPEGVDESSRVTRQLVAAF
jgi:hypothetical protein